MIKELSDIINLKGEDNDINELIVNDCDVIEYFEKNGLAGCEYIPDVGLGQDQDFDELLEYLNAEINETEQIINNKRYIKIYDSKISIMVKIEEYQNRFSDDSPDELFYDFNDIKILS